MKILVCVITYNCAREINFFLRHYMSFADEIWAFDDFSTDGTRPILSAFDKVKRMDWPHPGSGIDENLFLQFAYETYPKTAGKFDWVIWADPDEIIYHPNIKQVLQDNIGKYDVIRTSGFNMTGDGFPKSDGNKQIWEILQTGVRAPTYSKPIIFNPAATIRWSRGKHRLEVGGLRVSEPLVKLLHYRYLGADYTRIKNAANYARCGLRNGDKGAAWSCAPNWDAADKEHTPLWSEFAKTKAFNVIDSELYE